MNVGATSSINAVLRVGGFAEMVTVTANVVIDTSQTDVSSLVNSNQIQDLPINGRRYYDFALLAPGVTRDGRFGLLSFRGTSGNFANYMVEGNDEIPTLRSTPTSCRPCRRQEASVPPLPGWPAISRDPASKTTPSVCSNSCRSVWCSALATSTPMAIISKLS